MRFRLCIRLDYLFQFSGIRKDLLPGHAAYKFTKSSISNLHYLTGNTLPVPAVLGLLYSNGPVNVLLFFSFFSFLTHVPSGCGLAAAAAVRNCFGTLKFGNSIGERRSDIRRKVQNGLAKVHDSYINIGMCKLDVVCDVRGACKS